MSSLQSFYSLLLVSILAVGGCGGSGSSSGSNNQTAADTLPPVITLLGEAAVSVEQGADYSDAGATASDNSDGDISANITIDSTVDSSTVGVYQVTYNVSDAAGNAAAQVVRIVTVTAFSGTGSEKWSLVWSDEFNDSAVNLENWSYMTGDEIGRAHV